MFDNLLSPHPLSAAHCDNCLVVLTKVSLLLKDNICLQGGFLFFIFVHQYMLLSVSYHAKKKSLKFLCLSSSIYGPIFFS